MTDLHDEIESVEQRLEPLLDDARRAGDIDLILLLEDVLDDLQSIRWGLD